MSYPSSFQTSTRASTSTPSQNAPQLRPWTPHPRATNYVFPSSPTRAENSMVSTLRCLFIDWMSAAECIVDNLQFCQIFCMIVFLWLLINRELGIEAGVPVAPYPSGHLHSHLPHYHAPPRLHHFPISVMVRALISMQMKGHFYITSG